jgi:hypothetical protein
MCADQISSAEKTNQLKEELSQMHGVDAFLECKSMGEITFLNLSVTLELQL